MFLFSNLLPILILLFLFSITISIHEFAHGYVADRLGDPTARLSGRLSLNPLAHYDLIGSTLLLLGLFGFGPIIGWAKPVPIDPYNFRNPRRDAGLTALAGPVSNLLLALLAALIIRFFPLFFLNNFLVRLVGLNVGLAIFNLIPLGPLDGFKIVLGFLPANKAHEWEKSENIGLYLLLFLLFFPLPFFSLSGLLSIINRFILNLLFGSSFSLVI